MLKLGRKTYRSRAVDSPSVLVTLHRILSIVIPERVSKSGHTEPAQYVDIPLENISEMDIREAPEERLKVSAENHVKSILDIHLVKEAGCTFYVNARAHQQPFVCLAFDTASVADDLKSLISSQKSLIRPGSITNRSPLNVSQNDLTRTSGSRLVGGGYPFILDAFQGGSTDKLLKGSKHPSIVAVGTSDAAHDEEEILAEMVQVVDPQRLVATATRFNNLLTQGPALIPLDPRSAATVSDPNPSPSASRHPRVRVSDGGSPIDPNLAGIEGDPGPRFGPAQPRGQKPVRISEGVLTDSQSFHYTGDLLDQSYTSTAQWRDGASTIEHAPEFSEVVYDSFKLNEPMPEDVEQSMSPESDRSGDSRRLNGVHGVPHRVANNPATRLPTQTSGGLGSLAARVNTSTGARKALALKVSQRLLGRQGERIRPTKAAGDESPATKPQEASKSGRVSTKNVPTKQSPPKIKTTYKSKDRKEVQQSASKEQPVGPTGEASVFDIPSSPTKTARKPLKSKPSKPAATDAKPSEKSSTQVKRKTKQPTKASAGKATTSKDASVPPIQDKEDPEHDNSKQNIADKNDDNRKSRPSKRKSGTPERPGASTVSEKEDAPKETTAQVAKQPPAETTESGPKTTAASKKHKSAPALLRHPERRRAAAINANQKIQGLSTKAGETPQDNGETLGSPGHVEGVHDDDRADEAEDEDQGVSDIIGGSDASKGNSATNSVVLMEPVVDSAIGNGHVDEQVPQPQDVPEVLRADQPNMRVPNIEPSAATALRTVNGARKVQMITATTEEIQAATKPYIHKNDTPTIPAANTISLEVSVDLLDTEGQLDRSGGSIQRHIEAITDGGPLPDAGVPPLENTIEATTTSSKSPRVNLDTAAKDFRFKEVANGAESYGVSGKYTTRLDPNLHLRGVAATDGPIFQKEIPIGKATESTTQGLRTTLVLESKVPSANQTLSKIMKDNLERTEQVIQISSAEEASPESDARSLQKDIMPTISQHRYNKKRKSEDIIEDSVKRTKHSTPGPAQKARAPEEMDAIATDGYIQRKSVIIGFDAKGPRNQGVYSGKRPKTFAIPHGPESGFSRNTPSLSVKRKHPDEQESNVPSGAPRRAMKTPAEKRRRMVTVVPPTPGESSRNFSQVTSPNLASQSHKMSSQGSRVLDNGSPIAAGDQVRRVNRVDVDHLLRHLSNKEDDDLFMADSLNRDDEDEAPNDSLWEAELPLPTRPHKFPQPASIQALKHYERRSSSNTKALPSSPTAPSRMLEAMTAHKIADDGRFVNVHTATVLTAAEPQDPFMDNSHNLPNPFLTMLRASTQEDGGKREKCAKKTSITQRAGVDDSAPLFDPDRTLVEVDPRHYGRLPPSSHGKPSSSPPSISNRSSLPSESDKDETRAELAQMWMEALRPHQRGALASLHEMSNVSRIFLVTAKADQLL